jgi:hypothetical protein
MHRRGNCLDQWRRIGIALKRPHADNAAILHLGEKGAPMGVAADELGHGVSINVVQLNCIIPRGNEMM